jgi:glycosyltransferase involved in cell wall biosynthesis
VNVSVLIATYGDPLWETLARSRALPSAQAQPPFEILVRHEPDGTVTSSRNTLAEMARGDWLCFLDADDELALGYLGAMRRALEQKKTAEGAGRQLLLTPAVTYVREGRPRRVRRGRFQPQRDLRDHNWLVIGTLISRRFFHEIGAFDVRDPHGLEDWGLWSRADAAGAEVVKVPGAVYVAHARRVSSHAAYARSAEYGREYTRIRRSIHPELYA